MYHAEDEEDYNGEEKRHLYIDCHIYYINLSLNLSALIHDLKTK